VGEAAAITILGGGSFVAPYLFARLAGRGQGADVVGRDPGPLPAGFRAVRADVTADDAWRADPGSTVLGLAPIWVMADAAPRLAGAAQVVAVGSTSVAGKAASAAPAEQAVVARLADAEARLTAFCTAAGVACTILRPTMIYDCVNDRNVTRLARFVARRRVLPVAGRASGLRQPIHADDVAAAVLAAVANPAAHGRTFDIAGPAPMTYRAMAEAIFAALGLPPRFLEIPVPLVAAAARLGRALRLPLDEPLAMLLRMNDDLVYDFAPGVAALRLIPRPFAPRFDFAPA
jgi:nucleoside-diphosphate-sugar epimerase